MGTADITSLVMGILLGILVIVAIWAVIEIAVTVRKARATVDDAQKVIKQAEPLVDHVTLTVDAANLEIMRLDGILENVDEIAQAASSAADAVNKVTNAPVQIATSIADRFRMGAKSRARDRKAANNLAAGHADAHRLDGDFADEAEAGGKVRRTHGVTVIDPSPVKAAGKSDKEEKAVASEPAVEAEKAEADKPEAAAEPDAGTEGKASA